MPGFQHFQFLLLLSMIFPSISFGSFLGGTLHWSSENNDTSVVNETLTIVLNQRYAWSRTHPSSACSSNTIIAHGLIGTGTNTNLRCLSDPTICSSTNFITNISSLVPCTDYNTNLNLSQGSSETWLDFNVLPDGLIIGFASINDTWTSSLVMGGGNWSLVMYLNLLPRAYSGLVNHSPSSTMSLVNYVVIEPNQTTSISIPMTDIDGDTIQCRFAQPFNVLSGNVIVDECGGICHTIALPSSAQLISVNNTCTLNVVLPATGSYAVAVQLEDYFSNSTLIASSVPLQFIIIAKDKSNINNCTRPPSIIGVSPDFPSSNSIITVAMNTAYVFTVIAQIGCVNDSQMSIIDFINSSPTGMLRDDFPSTISSSIYTINHTWMATADQYKQKFTFCTKAVDSNYYSSDPYCFQFFVDHPIVSITNQSSSTLSLDNFSTEQDTTDSYYSTEQRTTEDYTTEVETTWTTTTTTTSRTTTSATTTTTTSATTTTTTSATTTTTTSATTTTTTSATTTTTTTTATTTTSVTTTTTTTSATTTTTATTTTSVTTTTTTSTTSTSVTTTTMTVSTTTSSNQIPLILGLGLGLGIPLLLLLCCLLACYCCSCCLGPLRWILRLRYKERSDEIFRGGLPTNNRKIADISRNQTFESLQETHFNCINERSLNSPNMSAKTNRKPPIFSLNASNQENEDGPLELSVWTTATATSFLSPSMNSLSNDSLLHRVASPLLPPVSVGNHGSILDETYEKQQQQKEPMSTDL